MPVAVRRILAGLAAQVLALTLAACGGGDDGGSSPPPPSNDVTVPSIPGGVMAEATSPTQIRLTWTASTDVGTGVAGYRIFRNGAATALASVTTTTFTDSNLNPESSYSYNVRAFDGASPPNESGLSAPATATTPAAPVVDVTPPSVPTNLGGTALSTTQIRLDWTASTDVGIGVAGYYVYRDGATTPTATVTGATTFTDSGLTANTGYSYALRAFDAAMPPNVSNATAAINVNTLALADTTPPTVPTNLTATAVSNTSIRLNWSASTDAGTGVAGYRVYQNGSGTPLAGTVTGVTTTLTNLAANTAYSFTVTAIDKASPANESGPSNSASATTPGATDTTAPSVPTNVAAAAQSSTAIQVSWTASTDDVAVAGYRVFRNGSATVLATVTGTSYTDTGLTPSTGYTYQVRAFDTAATPNVSALSTPAASAITLGDTTAPSAPTGVAATALSLTDIRIDWTASTDQGGAGLAGYRIFRNGSSSVLATVTNGTSYTDAGLSPNTNYSYQVRAFDGANPPNESALSTPAASATTQADTTAPTIPSGVTATAVSGTQIRIDWTASTDAGVGVAGYRIYRDGSTSILATVTSGTTFTDSGLTLNTTYSYQVLAFDNATPSNVSALSTPAASATTQADNTAPTVPSSVAATALSSTQIRVDWTASTDAGLGVAGYRIYRNGNSSVLATVTSGTSFTDGTVLPNTTYTYQVRAYDNALPPNVSALSTPAASATTPADTTAPAAPSGVTATVLSASSIRIDWSASVDTGGAGLAGYRVYRDGSSSVLATVTSGTSYTDSGLTLNTTYSYQVRAFDNATPANVSALSTPAASATTLGDTAAPSVPAGVSATALSSTSIRIDWNASTDTGGAGLAGYRVYRNGSSTILATVTSGTTYTDTGLTAATNYSYQLRAFDAATPPNVSGLSTSVNATTDSAGTPTSGLDSRPANSSCVAGAAPSSSASFAAQRVFSSLSFSDPVAILQAPGDNSRWFIVQQGGIVKVFNNVANPGTPGNFIDISGRVTFSGGGDERGLLSMAFHPNYPTDPRVYLYYTGTDASLGAVDVLSEFQTTNGGTSLDASTENILFKVDDPESNHNGGTIAFAPDGYLYSSIGDGGGGDDQHGTIGNGQRLTILLGKMLRIDVGNTPGAAYTIPATNLYAGNARCNASGTGSANCPEIYAYGFRNPWRWSFDSGSGELWLGDVGESAWEEIDKVVPGGNYGWRCREGSHAGPGSCGPNPSPIAPVAEVDHSLAAAITGGYVYRGSAISGLAGRYVFADFSSGYIWNIARDTTPTMQMGAGYQSGQNIAGFGEDQAHELYFLDLGGGGVYKLVPSGGGGGVVAGLLSQTGCANGSNPKLPSSGMIPYAPNAAFWSDGAAKSRWLALPDGQRITVDAGSNHFDFPVGSVLRKDFTVGGTLAETRLFMHHTDGSWAGYTYQWNAQGTDATRVVGGLTTMVNGQSWEFPSEAQCLMCHTSAAGRTLGLETGQLNGDLTYPSTGRTANQVFTLDFISALTPAVTSPIDQLPLIPNPSGSAPVGERARAWLHTNCANCHRPGGPTPVNLDFRYTTSLLGTNTCDVQPTAGNLGIANARLIAPGDASRSVVVSRVNRTDADMMPPLARHTIDTAGVQLLTSWINGLSGCN